MVSGHSTLRDFLKNYMDRTGETQTDISTRAELSISDINGIVQGRIKLPGADKRRRLARAMGVSHLDILIEAGEITREEVRATGSEGIVPADPVRAEIVDKVSTVRLTPERIETLEHILNLWMRRDRNAGVAVEHPARAADERGIG